ncbi:MAG: ester cyclase [Janthinobacterium lividum]
MTDRDHAKQIATQYFQAFIDGDIAWWRQNVSPDFIRHDPGLPYEVVGPAGLKHHHDVLLKGVPNLNLPIHDVMEDEGKVLVRLRFRGTHGGELFGRAATGNAIDVEVFDLFRVVNGKLVEHWAMVDTLGLMKQLGVTSSI